MSSHEEYKTEFSMWAMMAAPLIVATDVRPPHFTDHKKEILLNKEIIAIDQDPLGVAGNRVALFDCPNGSEGNLTCQVWARPLKVMEQRRFFTRNVDFHSTDSAFFIDIGVDLYLHFVDFFVGQQQEQMNIWLFLSIPNSHKLHFVYVFYFSTEWRLCCCIVQ